jgi:hypothetical protein
LATSFNLENKIFLSSALPENWQELSPGCRAAGSESDLSNKMAIFCQVLIGYLLDMQLRSNISFAVYLRPEGLVLRRSFL